jgi:hypothetical protein
MSEVWRFLTKPIFTMPAYTRTLCAAVLVFMVTAYAGYRISAPLVYRYESSKQFESLGKGEAAKLRDSVLILRKLDMSRIFVPPRESNLRENAVAIERAQNNAPQNLKEAVGLQRAMDYLALYRLEQTADSMHAADDLRSARAILQEIGWRNLSDREMAAFADEEIKWKVK